MHGSGSSRRLNRKRAQAGARVSGCLARDQRVGRADKAAAPAFVSVVSVVHLSQLI